MLALAATIGALPLATEVWHVYLYGAAMGAAGGIVTVIFFSCWSKTFGRLHLGRIQGAAQGITVLASAAGPLLLADVFERTGSYTGVFLAIAALAVVLAAFCWVVPLPSRK
jgi:hypothetical protein